MLLSQRFHSESDFSVEKVLAVLLLLWSAQIRGMWSCESLGWGWDRDVRSMWAGPRVCQRAGDRPREVAGAAGKISVEV